MAVNIGNLVAGESEIELSYISIPALKGDKGDTGRGISSVIKTSTVGLVDTWTITYTDGSTSSFDVTNGADGDDYVITSEDYQEIADIVLDNIEIPSKTSDLENDSGFIDNTVNDLQNYYKKSETYTKQEVDGKVSSVYKYKGSVATYQDLPSTSLTIGDVYNVESTGDNYAWTGTTWDKLGGDIDLSEYYTKTQVDSALENKVDKVTGKGLSTNDFTNADKTKLNSLENYDDTEVKSDIETLEESQASQDEIIAKLKADHPDIEEEGTDLSINGTGDFELALSPKGNIEQETREGYNLLNQNLFTTNGSANIDTLNNGEITSTTLTDSRGVRLNLGQILNISSGETVYAIVKIKSSTYTGILNAIQLMPPNSSTAMDVTYTIISNPNISSTYQTYIWQFTATENIEIGTLYFQRRGAVSGSNVFMIKDIMLSKQNKPYEPYGASPSPSYPSPVKVVDGEYEVEVENKNLCNKSTFIHGYYDYQNKQMKPQSASWNRTSDFIEFTPNTNYAFSLNQAIHDFYIYELDKDKNVLARTYSTNSSSKTATSKALTKYIVIDLGYGAIFTDEIFDTFTLQLEKNSTATSYIAHAEQTQTIDTSSNPLYSENDYYYKSNGKWYVHNEWAKYVFTGNETWFIGLYSGMVRVYTNIFDNLVDKTQIQNVIGYSNRFIYDYTKTHTNYTKNYMAFYTEGHLYIWTDYAEADLDEWKNYLRNNTTYIYYKLATPTNTEITDTDLINSLEALSNMKAYQDQTNISQTHNTAQADMIINAQTIMSMRYLQNEIEELKQAILNS